MTGSLDGILAGLNNRDGVVLLPGTISREGTSWIVTHNNSKVDAVWCQFQPRSGACLLAVAKSSTGQETTYVLSTTDSVPYNESTSGAQTGTVSSYSAGTQFALVRLHLAAGQPVRNVAARVTSQYTPAVNDVVMLVWQNSEAWMIGRVNGTYTATVPSAVPYQVSTPAPPVKGAVSHYPPQHVLTWTNTEKWAQRIGGNSYTGTHEGVENTAYFFYGNDTVALASRTVTDAKLFLGARESVGSFQSSMTINLWRHDGVYPVQDSQPSLVDGPFPFSIPAGWSGGDLTLPQSFADTLKAGGGIAIQGSPYAGFAGAGGSGNLRVRWVV